MTKKWGPATWYLLHTICEKISDELLQKEKTRIVNLLKGICTNLPCGECSKHAKGYTKTLVPRIITDKESLKSYFFTFHNKVNQRLRKPVFSNFDMYKLTTLKKVFTYYNQQIDKSVLRTDGFNNTLFMKRNIKELTKFVENNWEGFNWG